MERKDHTLESHDKVDKMTDFCGTNSIPAYTHTGGGHAGTGGRPPERSLSSRLVGQRADDRSWEKHKQENPRTVCVSANDSLF